TDEAGGWLAWRRADGEEDWRRGGVAGGRREWFANGMEIGTEERRRQPHLKSAQAPEAAKSLQGPDHA
ncbi:MAG: hypothetical protein LBR80_15895, partial [Deltaproteobacteria bacterium]|nr:hypothetical protein [Deltaproteobacteria bacterium]